MSGFEMMRLASERLKLGRIAAIEAAMNEGLVLGGPWSARTSLLGHLAYGLTLQLAYRSAAGPARFCLSLVAQKSLLPAADAGTRSGQFDE